MSLVSKFGTTNPSNQRSYRSRLMPSGVIDFSWSTAGSTGITMTGVTPLPAQANGSRRAVATQFRPNDGAGNRRLGIYTAPTREGPWTLHEEVVTAGTSSVHAGTAPLELGAVNTGALERFTGRFHYAAVINGLLDTGTPVVEFLPMNFPNGNATLSDPNGAGTWTLNGGTAHVNTGIPPGSTADGFAVDLALAGSYSARTTAPAPTDGPGGVVSAHLGLNADSSVTYGPVQYVEAATLAEGLAALDGLGASWPPAAGGWPMPAARWRRRRGRR
jgi:hypothetical protein